MSETKFVHFITPHETLEIPVEAVSSPTEIAKGLMNRFYFADNSGFLFEFGKETRQSFWMKDTRIPLSIAFIDNNGSIINIQDMDPFSTEPVTAPAPYVAALEVHQGFFEKHGIKIHNKIKIENTAHPVRIGEALNYDGEHAEATHHGLEDHDELTLWDDVDWGLVTLPRPRVIKSNKPLNRKHLAFKFVSFVKRGTTNVPEFWTRLRHPSPSGLDAPGTPQEMRRAGRPIDDDRIEESWRNIDDIYNAHGVSLEGFSGSLSGLARQAIERGQTDQLGFHRAARANDFEPQDVIDMGTGIHGFSRHAMASTIALFSPKQRMYGGKGHHNSTLHQSIMAMDLVGKLSSSAGLEVTQDHINQIEKTKLKLRKEIAASSGKPGRQKALQEHHDSIVAPATPGTYNINDFSDHGILAMIPGGGSYGSKLAGIQMLASEKREGSRPLRIEDVVKRKNGLITVRDPETGKKIKGEKEVKHEIGMQSGPKVVSFAHNLEFPDQSDSFTSDARIKSLLHLTHDKYSIYCGSNCARPKDEKPKLDDEDYEFDTEAADDPYATESDAWGTAGWDAIDLRSDVRRGQGDWPASKSYPGRKSIFYGPGAGSQWQAAGADQAFQDVFGARSIEGPVEHGVEMNIQRFQNAVWPETILSGSFGNLDPRAKDLEKERLATSLDEFYLPSDVREHLKKGESTSLACRHVHPYLEMAKDIRAKRLSGFSVVRDPSVIRSVLRSSAGDTLDFGSASAPRVQVENKSPRERIEVGDGAFTAPKTPGKSKTKTSPKTKTTPKSKGETKTTPKTKKTPTKKKPTKKSPSKKTPTKKVKKKVVKKKVVKRKRVVKKQQPTTISQPKTLKPTN